MEMSIFLCQLLPLSHLPSLPHSPLDSLPVSLRDNQPPSRAASPVAIHRRSPLRNPAQARLRRHHRDQPVSQVLGLLNHRQDSHLPHLLWVPHPNHRPNHRPNLLWILHVSQLHPRPRNPPLFPLVSHQLSQPLSHSKHRPRDPPRHPPFNQVDSPVLVRPDSLALYRQVNRQVNPAHNLPVNRRLSHLRYLVFRRVRSLPRSPVACHRCSLLRNLLRSLLVNQPFDLVVSQVVNQLRFPHRSPRIDPLRNRHHSLVGSQVKFHRASHHVLLLLNPLPSPLINPLRYHPTSLQRNLPMYRQVSQLVSHRLFLRSVRQGSRLLSRLLSQLQIHQANQVPSLRCNLHVVPQVSLVCSHQGSLPASRLHCLRVNHRCSPRPNRQGNQVCSQADNPARHRLLSHPNSQVVSLLDNHLDDHLDNHRSNPPLSHLHSHR